jgi:SET domain-containing protein
MLAELFYVEETKNKGKGLFAKEFIPKGTITWVECDKCKVFSASEINFNKMSEKEKWKLFDYAYRREDGSFFAPCGDAKYFNHSCNANILDSGTGFDIVVRDIKKGEEATYDYRCFYDDLKMQCNCGEKNCCKVVDFKHPVPQELELFWSDKVQSALKLSKNVDQPLKEELKRRSISFP